MQQTTKMGMQKMRGLKCRQGRSRERCKCRIVQCAKQRGHRDKHDTWVRISNLLCRKHDKQRGKFDRYVNSKK